MLRVVCLSRQTLQEWNSAPTFEMETILLRHFACGKIFSIVTNVEIVTNVSKAVGTRLKHAFFPRAAPCS